MKIFYTGAAKFGAEQPQGFQSLGGYIGASEAENDTLNTLFGGISEYGKTLKNKPEYRGLVIFNDGDVTLTGLKVWFERQEDENSDVLDEPWTNMQIGLAEVSANDCGDLSIAKSVTSNSKPMGVTFVTADEEGSALSLPDLEAGLYVGIFISRSLTTAPTTELTEEQYLAILDNELSLAEIEGFDLKISYD